MEGSEIDDVIGSVIVMLFALSPFLIIVVALLVGRALENRHFKSIREREATYSSYPAVPTQSWDFETPVIDSRLVAASVVVSLDHFKRILAGFRNFFGGNIRSYESLLDRARREAILRLKEQASDCHIIVNLRLVTSNIASIQYKNKGTSGVEVLAFGTAVRYNADPRPSGTAT